MKGIVLKKLPPMDYIYTKKEGNPNTFLELYGEKELFSMIKKGYVDISGPYVWSWFITEKGKRAAIAYNPEKYKPTLFGQLMGFLSRT